MMSLLVGALPFSKAYLAAVLCPRSVQAAAWAEGVGRVRCRHVDNGRRNRGNSTHTAGVCSYKKSEFQLSIYKQ